MAPVTIPLSKKKLIKNLIGSFLFVVAGIFFILKPFWFIRSDNPKVIVIIGYIIVGLFGLIGLVLLRKLFDKTPGLVLDEEGLIDNSSGVAAGKVYWKDVRRVYKQEVAGQPFVMLEVKNPEVYLRAQKNPIRKQVMELNYRLYKTPVSISAASLRISFQELFLTVEDKHRQSKG